MPYSKKTYKTIPTTAIDIRKPISGEDKALIALRRTNLMLTKSDHKLKEIIIEFNNKMRSRSPKKIADVVRYWFSEYYE